jgi:ferrous iron transport protein B
MTKTNSKKLSKPKVDKDGRSMESVGAQTVILLGNPNTGKSTLFNALCGLKQRTGNYPGVTVERRDGTFEEGGKQFRLVDLPGTYSLAPESPDEMLSVNVLLGRPPANTKPDLIVCVVDASNLERNLFLVSQILDLNQPTVVALNMTDIAARNGQSVDVGELSRILGVPVVPIQAKRHEGIAGLKNEIAAAINQRPAKIHDPFQSEVAERVAQLESVCPTDCGPVRFVITRLLFDANGFMSQQLGESLNEKTLEAIKVQQTQMRAEGSFAVAESNSRYQWIRDNLTSVTKQHAPRSPTVSDRVDQVLTHPFWGLIIAAATMIFLFQLVFWAAEPASMMIDWMTGGASSIVDDLFVRLTGAADGPLHSLIIDGLIAGVGGVLIFLPQIVLLFLLLAIMEDSGYLARAAFLTDRYLSRLGLSGITLIPLLSSFACAIPGIMAARVIRDPRERLITILIAPLMSCSARLPVYTLLIAAFVPATTWFGFGLQGLTMFAMYLVGIITAVCVAWVLKRTILKTGASSFVLELPTYKLPSFQNVFLKVWQGASSFVKDAGTVIVAATIIVWAAAYFPRDMSTVPPALVESQQVLLNQMEDPDLAEMDRETISRELNVLDGRVQGHLLRSSYLGQAGALIEPLVKPLGWDWRIGSAAIASFPAREVIVSTMGVLFGLGGDVDEESPSLNESIKQATWEGSDRPLFTLPVALSIMVFFALCAQCVSTLAVIKRETNSWFWPIFTFVYMTALAYIAALITYQIGRLFLA